MAKELKTYQCARKAGTETSLAILIVVATSRKRVRQMIQKEWDVNPKDYKIRRIKREEVIHHTFVRKTQAAEHSESPMID